MSQDLFNKIVTIVLLAFFMTMFVVSFITNKPLNVQDMLAFLIPTVNHVVHQITGSQVVMKNVDAQIATVTAGSTNGTSTVH